MKLHRFIGSFDFTKDNIEITNPENIKQIKGVLRLEIGDNLILSSGLGRQIEVTIKSMSTEKIVATVEKEIPTNDPIKKVSLFLAILKKENFELAVQKAVECGISNIIPIITERTIKTGLNIPRLEKIILEATEQCERSTVPILQKIIKFENALALGYPAEEKIIFDPSSSEYTPKKDKKSASIFIGPEGGFSAQEITLARTAGYSVSSIGPLILRGETAAIIATYRTVHGV